MEDNLLLAAQFIYKDEKILQERVEKMLELLSIEPIRMRKGLSLSGGERRRCEIARSLICEPKFLLLDEPFAGVDPIAVAEIQRLIAELKALDIGILITDHNVRETLAICDKTYVIRSGSLLASGSASEISNHEDVRKYYLGAEFKLLE